jgi:hypothetical protein
VDDLMNPSPNVQAETGLTAIARGQFGEPMNVIIYDHAGYACDIWVLQSAPPIRLSAAAPFIDTLAQTSAR